MARYVVTAFLSTLVLLHSGCQAATLTSEKESIVRREASRSASQLYMGSHGEIIASLPHTLLKTDEKLSPTRADTKDINKEKIGEFCNDDFPLGRVGTSNCTEPALHSLILEESLCVEAAIQAGAHTTHDSFSLVWQDFQKHPKGCFKDACDRHGITTDAAPNNVCYFFNGYGDWPDNSWNDSTALPAEFSNLSGTPVCSRLMYRNSDAPDTNGGCPAGYTIVDDADECLAASNCIGDYEAEFFLIGQLNASTHLDFPRGCFLNDDDHKVYYNPPNPQGIGTNVKGTLICNVSVSDQVHWGETPAEAAATQAAHAAATAATAAGATDGGTTTDGAGTTDAGTEGTTDAGTTDAGAGTEGTTAAGTGAAETTDTDAAGR